MPGNNALPTDRRTLLLAGGAGIAAVLFALRNTLAAAQSPGPTLSVTDFGAHPDAADNSRAIQAAIAEVERKGGGTVLIPGRFRCGNIVISGRNVTLKGSDGWLVDGRLTIAAEAADIEVVDLNLLDTSGDRRNFLMNVAGRNCRFDNVQLLKDPVAPGYQMYLRPTASGCHFTRLRLKGSNGIMVTGSDHIFEGFELESMMSDKIGGDDAFAIQAPGSTTENITIRNGTVRGFAAAASIGSVIGSKKGTGPAGLVRNVTVENVTADRCTRLVFIKPGSLDTDWQDGLVEQINLRDLKLSDPQGEQFRSGVQIFAGRGAIVRGVHASGISIVARASHLGEPATSAIDIRTLDKGSPARIENVDLQVVFTDPYSGAAHSAAAPGYPVEFIVRVERNKRKSGSMSGIALDVEGKGAWRGGMSIGPGLDGAVHVNRAILTRVATDPPAKGASGGIWSNSQIVLGNVEIESGNRPKFGGSAFGHGQKPKP